MTKKLIGTLLHFAQVDGKVSGSELALIYKIAVEKGIPMFEVEQMVQNPPREAEDLQELSENDRFEFIYTIVLMMKMDGVLDDREAAMCSKYAVSLGYDQQVIPELLDMIKSDHTLSGNKQVLMQEVQKFIR